MHPLRARAILVSHVTPACIPALVQRNPQFVQALTGWTG
ncbi:hypothetical protein HRbin26_01636 [bacterium HR26]|nr:hypothetical protein HRbin26_01636 [bacterium HR26]